MRAFLVLALLQFVAVRGDACLGREIDEAHLDMEKHDLHPAKVDGALGVMLAPRADPNAVASEICGYQGGKINQPWVCAVNSLYCVVEPSEGVVGCCFSNFCGAFKTACYAQTDPCDAACSSNDQNLICTGDKPLCATYSYSSHVTEVRCESTIPSQLSIAYTYTGFSTPILLPRIAAGFSITSQGASFSYLSLLTGTQSPTSSAAAPSSSPTSTFATSTSISSPSTAPITSTPAPVTSSNAASSAASTSAAPAASTSSPAPVGAIVGGVIGGLAIIAAFAALVIWIRYKKAQTPPPDSYPQLSSKPASAFQLTPTTATPANDAKVEQTRSMVNEAYVPPARNHYVAPPGQENELPGQMRWS